MPSIRDFSGGVLNQELLGKDGGAGIMIDANNVLSSWNGELRKRTGSRIVAQLEKKSRIIPYRLPNNDDALLLFTDGNVKGYEIADSGLVPLYVSDSSKLEYPMSGWSNRVNGDWAVKSNYQRHDEQSGFVDAFDGVSGLWGYGKGYWFEFQNANEFVLSNLDIEFFYFGYAFLGENGYSYLYDPVLQFSDNGSTWTSISTGYSVKKQREKDLRYYTTVNIVNKDNLAGGHKFWRIYFETAKGVDSFFADRTFSLSNIIVANSSMRIFEGDTGYTQEQLEDVKFSQIKEDMFFACRGKRPIAIKTKDNKTTVSSFTPANTSNVWDLHGLPSCVCGYQNRLVFSGFNYHRNRVIMSEFGNPDNFTIKTTDVKSTDPISADSVELRAPIENLWAGNNALYALSSDGVSMIDAQGGVIATDQISFKLRNREPADGMTPTTKDDIMIYLGNDRRKIFITDYDFIVQRFKAKDLSVGYNGFLTSRIVALHYASRKCSLIYGYKDDGNMLALLFDVDMQKNALFPCDIGGDIKDMQVFKSGDKFRVLMVAQIDDRWYLIEKNEQPEYTVMDFMSESNKREYSKTVVQDGLYLDYMTRRYYSEPVSVITDVPYAVGTKVAVFADGNYIGEKDCTADGIVLDAPASDFVLGYNYDAYAVLKLATPYTSKKYPKEVATYLINTGYLEIGNSFDNLQPILNNMRDKLDLFDKPMLLNGEYTKTMDKLDNSPYIILRSNEPMPFMITGIDFKVDYSNYQGGI
jgi:hypothetical protein